MAKIYVRQIKLGKMTLEMVPQRWVDEVRALLEAE